MFSAIHESSRSPLVSINAAAAFSIHPVIGRDVESPDESGRKPFASSDGCHILRVARNQYGLESMREGDLPDKNASSGGVAVTAGILVNFVSQVS